MASVFLSLFVGGLALLSSVALVGIMLWLIIMIITCNNYMRIIGVILLVHLVQWVANH